MTSDTPRTDAEVWKPRDECGQDYETSVVDADFARELERELNRLKLILKRASDLHNFNPDYFADD